MRAAAVAGVDARFQLEGCGEPLQPSGEIDAFVVGERAGDLGLVRLGDLPDGREHPTPVLGDPDDVGAPVTFPERGAPMRAYARAKRTKLALAAGLAGDLAGRGVVVHAAGPGAAWTPMTRSLDRPMLGVPPPLWWLIRGVQRAGSPARAARCVVAAAMHDRYADPTGQLVTARRARPIPVADQEAEHALSRARALAASIRRRGAGPRDQ